MLPATVFRANEEPRHTAARRDKNNISTIRRPGRVAIGALFLGNPFLTATDGSRKDVRHKLIEACVDNLPIGAGIWGRVVPTHHGQSTLSGAVLGAYFLTGEWSLARRILGGAVAGAGTGLLITTTKMLG